MAPSQRRQLEQDAQSLDDEGPTTKKVKGLEVRLGPGKANAIASSKRIRARLDTLPAEIINMILSHCDRPELVAICQTSSHCYVHATPLLYHTFNPYEWSDLVQLKHSMRRGMGPRSAMSDLVAESIKVMDLRFHLSPSYDQAIDSDRRLLRAYNRAAEMTLGCLAYILERTKNLW